MRQKEHKGPRELVTGGEWLYGRNPVEEALAAGRRSASEIVLPPAFPDEDDQLRRIRDEARARRLVVRTMDRSQLDRITRFGAIASGDGSSRPSSNDGWPRCSATMGSRMSPSST